MVRPKAHHIFLLQTRFRLNRATVATHIPELVCRNRKNYIGHRKNYILCRKNYIRHNPNYIRPFLRRLQPIEKQVLAIFFKTSAIFCLSTNCKICARYIKQYLRQVAPSLWKA